MVPLPPRGGNHPGRPGGARSPAVDENLLSAAGGDEAPALTVHRGISVPAAARSRIRAGAPQTGGRQTCPLGRLGMIAYVRMHPHTRRPRTGPVFLSLGGDRRRKDGCILDYTSPDW